MILDEKHRQAAIEIIQKNRKKKSCNKCYDRGYIGFTLEKTIIPCEKCVEIEAAMEQWKQYVAEDETLKEEFRELFDEETTEETTETPTNPAENETHQATHAPTEKKVTKTKTKKPDTRNNAQAPKSIPRRSSRRGNG